MVADIFSFVFSNLTKPSYLVSHDEEGSIIGPWYDKTYYSRRSTVEVFLLLSQGSFCINH